MKKEKSLKKQILIILISFSIFIAISIGLIAMVNFYLSEPLANSITKSS
jgi:hypothetical protein